MMETSTALALAMLAPRNLIPIAVSTVIACGPLLWFALSARVPVHAAGAAALTRTVIAVAASGVVSTLVLVGAVAPLVERVALGTRCGPIANLKLALRGLAGAVLPVGLASAVVFVGGLALVLPGLVLLVLVAWTGASDAPDAIGRVVDSATRARRDATAIAITLITAILVVAAVIVLVRVSFPAPPKKPTAAHWRTYQPLAHAVLAWLAVAPAAAVILAVRHHRPRA